MVTKAIEIRDSGTTIAAIAFRNLPDNEVQRPFYDRCGFPEDGSSITLMKLYDQRATNDPYEWGNQTRTMPVAHDWIIKHFDEIEDGQVVDVEFLLGITPEPKEAEIRC